MSETQQSPNEAEVIVEVGSRRSNEAKGSESSASQILTKRKALSRSVYSKPKSRFGEVLPIMHEETCSQNRESPNEIPLNRIESSSAKNPLLSPAGTSNEEDKVTYNKVKLKHRTVSCKKMFRIIEWIVFLILLSCLVASLTVNKLNNLMVLGLKIWKWCVLVIMVSCGMLMTNQVMMQLLRLVILRKFSHRERWLTFFFRMKKSVQILMWGSMVLLTWLLLIRSGLDQSKVSTKTVGYITRSIVAVVIGGFLWLLKTLLVLILASKFEAVTYFDRIKEYIFHHDVLQRLSVPPLMKEAYEGVIDVTKLKTMKQEKVSSWSLKSLVEDPGEHLDLSINSEMEAIAAADEIFRKIAPPGAKFITELDLLRFLTKEEVDLVWPEIDVEMTGQVDRKILNDWVVKVYTGRKALTHALSDAKAVTAQVDNLMTSIVFIIIIVVSLLVVEIATTSFFVFLSSQLVLAALAFGNTCKNVFESVMFLFVAHPYDVGDCIVFEGVPMRVEEITIFTTAFLKLSNNEKVYYPNSVLSATSISNYSRSPDMRDSVEFSIALTPVEKIVKLKEKIKKYIERNPQYWHLRHNVAVIDIQDVNTLKMAIYCQHTMNFQDFEEKNLRRAELNFELLKILEELNITVLSAVLPKSESQSN